MKVNQFWYLSGDGKVGPIDIQILEKMKQKTEISESTLVTTDDGQTWQTYEMILNSLGEGLAHGSVERLNWLNDVPTPWRRYAARLLIDIPLNGLIGFAILGFGLAAISPTAAVELSNHLNEVTNLFFTVLVGCLLSGAMTGLTGFTIGKFIFGLKVKTLLGGQNIGLVNGLKRDVTVAFKGLWLGIPLFFLIPMYLNYKKLRNSRFAPWDTGQYLVLYRRSGITQYFLNCFGLVLSFSVYRWLGLV